MKRYVKRPIAVEAVQYDGDNKPTCGAAMLISYYLGRYERRRDEKTFEARRTTQFVARSDDANYPPDDP